MGGFAAPSLQLHPPAEALSDSAREALREAAVAWRATADLLKKEGAVATLRTGASSGHLLAVWKLNDERTVEAARGNPETTPRPQPAEPSTPTRPVRPSHRSGMARLVGAD